MFCFQRQIDQNICSITYGEIRHIQVPCPPNIICMEDPCEITIDQQEVNYGIVNSYKNSLLKDTFLDSISINHYCIDGITIFAIEFLKIFSDGIGGYYTQTVNITATGISC